MLSLIRQLPADSALLAANDPNDGWGTTEFLLADLVDEVAANTYATKVGSGLKPKSGGKFQPPKPVWRPGMDRAEPTSNGQGQSSPQPKRLPMEDPDEFFGKVTREVSAS